MENSNILSKLTVQCSVHVLKTQWNTWYEFPGAATQCVTCAFFAYVCKSTTYIKNVVNQCVHMQMIRIIIDAWWGDGIWLIYGGSWTDIYLFSCLFAYEHTDLLHIN